MTKPISLLHQMTLETPTQLWNDSCEVGSLRKAMDHGATGATSNPVIVLEAIEADRPRWEELTRKLIADNPTSTEEDLAWMVVIRAATEGAALLQPVFEQHAGKAGRLCLQVNPRYWPDAKKMVQQAERFSKLAPNMAIKVPAVAAGIEAIEELTTRGVVINATVLFTLPQALAVAEALERGLSRAAAAGLDIDTITPYVTIMVGRLDDHLRDQAAAQGIEIDPDHVRQASTALMRKAYRIFQQRGYRSTLLSAAMRSHHHWSEFIGGDLVITVPPPWLDPFNDSGVDVVSRIHQEVDPAVVAELLEKFSDFGRAYNEDGLGVEQFVEYGASVKTLRTFLDGYDRLLAFVRDVMLPL